MKLFHSLFLSCLLLLSTFSAFSQNGWGLVPGSSYGEEGYGIHVAYRLPGETVSINGRNIAPQAVPVIIGFTRTLEESHMLGAELGWVQSPRLLITDLNGNVIDEVPANTPQLRLSYKWMPLGGEHILEPYLGAGFVAAGTFSSIPGDRFQGINGDLQAMAGLRIAPGGPLFFQLELPYTYLTARQLVFPDGSTATITRFGPDFFMGQFWPLIGVGVKW